MTNTPTNNPTILNLINQHKKAEWVMRDMKPIPNASPSGRLNFYEYGHKGGEGVGPYTMGEGGDVINKIPPVPMPGSAPIHPPGPFSWLLQQLGIKKKKHFGTEVKPLDPGLKIKPGFI